MYCRYCGNKMEDDDRFCKMCGKARVNVTYDAAGVPNPAPAPPLVQEPAAAAPAQPNRKMVGIVLAVVAAIAIAVVVGLQVLGGPADPGASNSGTAASSAATSSSSEAAKDSGSSDSASSQDATEGQSADRIQVDGFSFELPAYWKGKVVGGKVDGGVALYPDTQLGSVEGYELVTLKLVSADEPENGGDYVTHVAGRVRGDGVRVDVVSKNWAAFYGGDWYRHPNYAGSSQEQEMAAALIDLSSGGAYSYDDVRSAAANASNDADAIAQFQGVDVDFLNETLIPTVQLDGTDGASDGSAVASNLSEEDRETIAEIFSEEMFTTAENTGDGGMRWIGCDHALQLVEDGSNAEACDYWEDTTFHVFLRVASDATITEVFDPGHYQVQVTYESALDATGANRQANIATIELRVNGFGYVDELEVISLA